MMNYIGLDAHASTSTFVVIDAQGQIKDRIVLKTTEANLVRFLKGIAGQRHLTFEESHLSQWLYLTLKDQVERLIVCNPTYLGRKLGAKTDFRDALHLAQELRAGHLEPVFHDKSHWIEQRSLVSAYMDLNQEIVRTKNRLKAVFRSEAIETEGSTFYQDRYRAFELSNSTAQFVAQTLYSHVQELEKRKAEFKEQFKANMKKYRSLRNLASVPGIDLVRANVIAAIVCTPHRFENKHKFWAYCMLVKHEQQSGGKTYGKRRIYGRSELKEAFHGAAESALKGETPLREHYEKLRTRGIAHLSAKNSVARKIAAICLGILKNNEQYQPKYEERREDHRAYVNCG